MSTLWEFTDEDGDEGALETASRRPGLVLLYVPKGAYLTPAAARSLRDALNAYLEQTSTAEGWELP